MGQGSHEQAIPGSQGCFQIALCYKKAEPDAWRCLLHSGPRKKMKRRIPTADASEIFKRIGATISLCPHFRNAISSFCRWNGRRNIQKLRTVFPKSRPEKATSWWYSIRRIRLKPCQSSIVSSFEPVFIERRANQMSLPMLHGVPIF
jgi:hypothetical protein